MAASPGKVSRQELMSEVWQYDYFGDLRAVDVAIRRLREKLETIGRTQICYDQARVGYYLNATSKLHTPDHEIKRKMLSL